MTRSIQESLPSHLTSKNMIQITMECPPSRLDRPSYGIMNVRSSTAHETKLCRYCYGMPSASKLQITSWVTGTITAQIPEVSTFEQFFGV